MMQWKAVGGAFQLLAGLHCIIPKSNVFLLLDRKSYIFRPVIPLRRMWTSDLHFPGSPRRRRGVSKTLLGTSREIPWLPCRHMAGYGALLSLVFPSNWLCLDGIQVVAFCVEAEL